MYKKKSVLIFLFLMFYNMQFALLIGNNKMSETLLKLVHQAVKPHKEYLEEDTQPRQGYGLLQSYDQQNNNQVYSHHPYLTPIYNHPNDLIKYPSYININRNPQTVTEILETIAINDKLHCIPRLLCEITSGSTTSTNTKRPSFLPFNIDMDSLQQILSSFNVIDVSPIILFGRAALIGLTSKGNDRQCTYSYPQCPSDPDQLVEYLNNYNGGFFRYFNGLHQPGNYYSQMYADKYPINRYRIKIGRNGRKFEDAEERILTKPYNKFYVEKLNEQIKFPPEYLDVNSFSIKPYHISQYKSPKTLVFPDYNNEGNSEIFKGSYRKRKGFSFPTEKNNELIFQKPLPNYPATPTLFPDRTGTGELIIDSERFQDNSNK